MVKVSLTHAYKVTQTHTPAVKCWPANQHAEAFTALANTHCENTPVLTSGEHIISIYREQHSK